jgi:hypothetical protein
MEGLPQEPGARPPPMDPKLVAAFLRHRGNAAIALDLMSTLVAFPLGTEGSNEPREQHRTGAG